MTLLQKREQLKQKLRSCQPIFAGWTSIGHPTITEIFAQSGVDFIGIDIEHSTISQEQSQRIIAASQAYHTVCLPRIASHNGEMIKRLLDSGADGLIVPMVSTSEEVEQLIAWIQYPPEGQRSFGIARGQGYGFDFESYTQSWNKSAILIVQIESLTGVENIDKILSYDAVDGAMVGPYDLSGSLGIPGQLDHPKLAEASKQVVDACAKHGKACGTQLVEPDLSNMRKALTNGFTFSVLASDIFLLWKWSARMNNHIQEVKG